MISLVQRRWSLRLPRSCTARLGGERCYGSAGGGSGGGADSGRDGAVGPPWNVLFFGTDFIALTLLRRLHEAAGVVRRSTLSVVCPLDLPSDKSIVTKDFARANDLQLFQPESLRDWKVPLAADGGLFDVAVVASYGKLIPSHVIRSFRFGGLNLHPSLLPRYPGAAPIYHQILNHEPQLGATIIELHPTRFDSGRIAAREPLPEQQQQRARSLPYRELGVLLAEHGSRLLLQVLADLHGVEARLLPQEPLQLAPTDPPTVAKATKISKLMGRIDWQQWDSRQLLVRSRAFLDTIGLTAVLDPSAKSVRLHLVPCSVPPPPAPPGQPEAGASLRPGRVWWDGRRLRVWCVDGQWVEVAQLQVQNGKLLTPADFANGFRLPKETRPDSA